MDQLAGRDQVFRKSTLMQDHPARGEVHNDVLQGESDGSQLSDNKRVTQKPEMPS